MAGSKFLEGFKCFKLDFLLTLILPKFCCIYAQEVATTDKLIQALMIPIRYWDFSDLPIRLIGVIGISVVPWCGWSSAHIVLEPLELSLKFQMTCDR